MKRILSLITVLFMSITMISCMQHIEDVNGEETDLATLNLENAILEGSYSSVFATSRQIYSGGTTYSFSYRDIDYDNIEVTYTKFSGISKVHCSDMDAGEELVLTITSSLTSGNFEIVVIGPDKAIIETVNINETITVTIPSTLEGEYFVVIGGESAIASIQISRTIN